MNFAEEISIITDALTYVEVYGPHEFPAEDCTDLTKEARRILAVPQAAFVVGPDGIADHARDIDPNPRNA